MKLIFDKGLETERSINVDRVSERPLSNRLHGSRSYSMDDAAPDLSVFTGVDIASVSAETDDGKIVPLRCSYTRIADVSVVYEDNGNYCHLNIAVEGDENNG